MWKIEDKKVDKQGLCTFTKEKQKKSGLWITFTLIVKVIHF